MYHCVHELSWQIAKVCECFAGQSVCWNEYSKRKDRVSS
ncbi:hypothetical protein I656_03636 [Geobacillus sp. WSUCF1]|nr:hypothetical protein I656_03636 [Geobacillus sp. WSUCF1]